MDHMFMMSGDIITEPKVIDSQYGPSISLCIKGDNISDISLPNGATQMAPMLNGKYKVKDTKIPFYCQKGKRVLVQGTFTSDAKQTTDEFKSLYVDFKQITVINTPGITNFAYGSATISKAEVGKNGVLYTLQEKKKPVGGFKQGDTVTYRFYRVFTNDMVSILAVGDTLTFQGIVLRGIFTVPAGYDKYGPLTQPIFYADTISGYIKKS